jgi:hypothetical protein
MKTRLMLALALCVSVQPLFGQLDSVAPRPQWSVTLSAKADLDTLAGVMPQVYVSTSFPVGQNLSAWTSMRVNGKSGDGVFGLDMRLDSLLTIGAGAGVEFHEDIWRVEGHAYGSKGKFGYGLFVQYGGSGEWHLLSLAWKPSKSFQLALVERRFLGTGLQVQYSLRNAPLTLIVIPLAHDWTNGKMRSEVGVRFTAR